MKLVGISGSLRKGSYNTALLRAAAGLTPEGVALDVVTLEGVPLYDGDLESRDSLPPAVAALKEAIVAADGVLLVTPEYNSGIPGVFKNAIDWTSRPGSDIARVWGGRPVAVIGASPTRSCRCQACMTNETDPGAAPCRAGRSLRATAAISERAIITVPLTHCHGYTPAEAPPPSAAGVTERSR